MPFLASGEICQSIEFDNAATPVLIGKSLGHFLIAVIGGRGFIARLVQRLAEIAEPIPRVPPVC